MSLIDLLSDEKQWIKFLEYKQSLACPKQFAKELQEFIECKRYLPVCETINSGAAFALPSKAVISKMGAAKKRVVYTYPEDENTVLKLLTWLLLRNYDYIFSKGLFSFRPGKTAKDAVRYLLKNAEIHNLYAYKVDIHDYFNSVPLELLLPKLSNILKEDNKLYQFLAALLCEPRVNDRGRIIEERKGIMAGTPLSAFYANVFLSDLDSYFEKKAVIYARYSDDIIVFAETEEEIKQYVGYIREYLNSVKLEVNPAKESFFEPEEPFTFLGFECSVDTVDIAPATVKKLKQKMRRKRDSLARWAKRECVDGDKAARAFIRIFNRKLLECGEDNELCWSSWFFPVINTTESLHEIDIYAQDCIRYLVSGRHTKARFNVTYEDIKALGYKNLVHEYYSFTEK